MYARINASGMCALVFRYACAGVFCMHIHFSTTDFCSQIFVLFSCTRSLDCELKNPS